MCEFFGVGFWIVLFCGNCLLCFCLFGNACVGIFVICVVWVDCCVIYFFDL